VFAGSLDFVPLSAIMEAGECPALMQTKGKSEEKRIKKWKQ
jgi:hypothetical protein